MLRSRTAVRIAVLAIVVIACVAGSITGVASSRQSATFDEIILAAGGARAVTLDRWDMVTDQPPLMMWLYGWAVASADPELPSEARAWDFNGRWDYARALFFESSNDPESLLARARAVTVAMAAGLVLVAGLFALWAGGPLAGVVAATFTAVTPDVLAHGGVAYNDVPLALAFLLCVWALDALVRWPTWRTGTCAGVALACAFGMKMSALALVPIAVALLAMEGASRWRDEGWRRDVGIAACVCLVAAYGALVVMYRGDLTLSMLRFNVWRTVIHASGGHPAPAFLLGSTSADGWWHYFPVAFLLKTPAGLHLALILALWLLGSSLFREWRIHPRAVVTGMLAWTGRAPAAGFVIFTAFLLRSDLNTGFRYALPAMPLLCVFIGVVLGVLWYPVDGSGDRSLTRLWRPAGRIVAAVRVLLVLAVSMAGFATVRTHPWHLSFVSVWGGGQVAGWRVLSDSNVDWGQGLLELRRFMQEEGVASVRLSYFGSARPLAYGIEYVALPSFFRLAEDRTPGAERDPRFTVISATNLHGLYFQGRDPFASYRERVPYRVLGNALFVFDDAPT